MKQQSLAIAAEQIESLALEDLYRSTPQAIRSALGMEELQIDGGRLFLAENEPSILLNRVIGLGLHGQISAQGIQRISECYRNAGISEYFLQLQPWVGTQQVRNRLQAVGLAPSRGWTQFTRSSGPVASRDSELRVRQIDAGHGEQFAQIAARGFDLSDAMIPVLAGMVGLPGWYHYMSFQGERPAGVAAMRIHKGFAWFDWAATDPEFRGEGSQTQLIAHRIRAATGLGCHTLFSETGEAVPGDPQHSFRNLMRAGFVPTHTRENFAPAVSIEINREESQIAL